MRIGWVGFHVEGLLALRALLEQGVRLEAVLTLREDQAAKRSGAADYGPLCREFGVPLHEVVNINDEHSLNLIRELNLDLAGGCGQSVVV